MRLMVAWGSEDRGQIIDSSRLLTEHLGELGIPHESLEFDGNHSWVSWNPVIEEALRRMVVGWGEAPTPTLRAPRTLAVASSLVR